MSIWGLEEKLFRPTAPTIETELMKLSPQISEKELILERVSEFTYYLKNRVLQVNTGLLQINFQSGKR